MDSRERETNQLNSVASEEGRERSIKVAEMKKALIEFSSDQLEKYIGNDDDDLLDSALDEIVSDLPIHKYLEVYNKIHDIIGSKSMLDATYEELLDLKPYDQFTEEDRALYVNRFKL